MIELTANHKRQRLEWAILHCLWRSQWSRVVWSDEASVSLRGRDGHLRVWMQSGDEISGNLSIAGESRSLKIVYLGVNMGELPH